MAVRLRVAAADAGARSRGRRLDTWSAHAGLGVRERHGEIQSGGTHGLDGPAGAAGRPLRGEHGGHAEAGPAKGCTHGEMTMCPIDTLAIFGVSLGPSQRVRPIRVSSDESPRNPTTGPGGTSNTPDTA